MSLPGRWADDPVVAPPPPPEPVSKPRRQFQGTNYSDPAVTQFVNENIKELDDLQNVEQLITSLNEQQASVGAQVRIQRTSADRRLQSLRIDSISCERISWTRVGFHSLRQQHFNHIIMISQLK